MNISNYKLVIDGKIMWWDMENIGNTVLYLFLTNISWWPLSVIKHKLYMRIQGLVKSLICLCTNIICIFTSELSFFLPQNIQCIGNGKKIHWLHLNKDPICPKEHFQGLVLRSWHHCPVSFRLLVIACSLRDESSCGRVHSHNRWRESRGWYKGKPCGAISAGVICGSGSILSKHSWNGELRIWFWTSHLFDINTFILHVLSFNKNMDMPTSSKTISN